MERRELGRYIRTLRKARGVDRKVVASALRADVSYITKIEKGNANFTIDKLLKIADSIGVQPYDLFAAEPLVPRSQAELEPVIAQVFQDQETADEFARAEGRDDFVPVRIIGTASLGQGRLVSREETQGYALIYKHALNRKAWKQPRRAEKIVCVWAQGDSMLPTIQDKSLVAIDVEDRAEIRKGKIYVVEVPDEGVVIKRVYRADDHLALFADNPATPGYPRCIALGQDMNPVRGRVVWTWNVLE